MTLRPNSPAYTASAVPADLEHLQQYVAALALRLPVIVGAHVADQQMVLHLLDEQLAYLHARRRNILSASTQDRQQAQHWCVLWFHLEALQKTLIAHSPHSGAARKGPACTCDLPYSPTLARAYPLDFYSPLEPAMRN